MEKEKREPLISIIVPVYKTEKYLNRCIESILGQSYRNLEVILVEDGSPDNSAAICDDWSVKDRRIHVIHQENKGAGAARNSGLGYSSGEYVSFVDSDDWIEKNMFMKLYELLTGHNADMAVCNIRNNAERIKREKQEVPKLEIWGRKKNLDRFFRVEGGKNIHSACGCLIPRHILDNFAFIEGRINEDIHVSYYLATRCEKVVYTNEAFYNYTYNKNGVTRSCFNKKKLDLLYMWDIIDDMVTRETPEYKNACEMNKKRARFTLLSKMYIEGYDKTDAELCSVKKKLKKDLRKDYWDLIRWRMPVSRKILMSFLVL